MGLQKAAEGHVEMLSMIVHKENREEMSLEDDIIDDMMESTEANQRVEFWLEKGYLGILDEGDEEEFQRRITLRYQEVRSLKDKGEKAEEVKREGETQGEAKVVDKEEVSVN